MNAKQELREGTLPPGARDEARQLLDSLDLGLKKSFGGNRARSILNQSRVTLVGLSVADLNGSVGICGKWLPTRNRYEVTLTNKNNRKVAIKPQNILNIDCPRVKVYNKDGSSIGGRCYTNDFLFIGTDRYFELQKSCRSTGDRLILTDDGKDCLVSCTDLQECCESGPGCREIPEIAYIKQNSNQAYRGLQCHDVVDCLTDLSADATYDKISRWCRGKKVGNIRLSTLPWNLLPASTEIGDEKLKLSFDWVSIRGGRGRTKETMRPFPTLIWAHSRGIGGCSNKSSESMWIFYKELYQIVLEKGKLSPITASSLKSMQIDMRVPSIDYKMSKGTQNQLESLNKVLETCCLPKCKLTSRKKDGTRLLRCSRCRIAMYCCPEHQKEHWNVHKLNGCKVKKSKQGKKGNKKKAVKQ